MPLLSTDFLILKVGFKACAEVSFELSSHSALPHVVKRGNVLNCRSYQCYPRSLRPLYKASLTKVCDRGVKQAPMSQNTGRSESKG